MPDDKPTCFIAMPITTHASEAETYGDKLHWKHVMDHLFVPAIEKCGYEAVLPMSRGSDMIHAAIVKNLEQCDLVLCDLSGSNPNVFFELGVRTSLDKPIAIVRDERTGIPFDLAGLNAHPYDSTVVPWNLESQIEQLAAHIREAVRTCGTSNPMWQQYGLTLRAQEVTSSQDPNEARISLLLDSVNDLRNSVQLLENRDTSSRPLELDEHAKGDRGTTERIRRLDQRLRLWSIENDVNVDRSVDPRESNLVSLIVEDLKSLSKGQRVQLIRLAESSGFELVRIRSLDEFLLS